MEKRLAILAKTGASNIAAFNARSKRKIQRALDEEAELETEASADYLTAEEHLARMTKVQVPRDHKLEIPDQMSYIVIIVDDLADLMQVAPVDVESAIALIARRGRFAGIHMILATQTPRVNTIHGVIKASLPCRIAFQVASALDSRVILDENGAEDLIGDGDMLYRSPSGGPVLRAQGALVTDAEIQRLVEHAAKQAAPAFNQGIHSPMDGEDAEEMNDEDLELLEKCIEVMRQEKKASTSVFQRRLRLGYTRAARLLDILEDRGYVGPGEGAQPREILVNLNCE
jgi:S-DNA-T family DNA segregation ATPase FtsK/SpoIIIE